MLSSHGSFFSTPWACALRNGWGTHTRVARVQLCYRHLDSHTRKLLLCALVKLKVAFAYLQSRECERVPRLELRRQRLHIGAAGGSTRTLTRLLPHTSPLAGRAMFRCSVVDSVPKATRTPPVCRCAHALKSHLFHRCRLEQTAGGVLLLTERS